jgi:hypothetical protein
MVSIVQTSTTTSGNPVAFIPQIGAVVTSQGEVVALNGSLLYNMTSNISNFCCGASSCSIVWGAIDIGIPSRAVFNVARSGAANYVFYYDLEANQLISSSCNKPDGVWGASYILYPVWFFTPWGEKILAFISPGTSALSGGLSIITRRWWSYPRIQLWYYYTWQTPPGFESDDYGPAVWGSSGYFNGYIYIIYHKGGCGISGCGRVVNYPAYIATYYNSSPAWLMNMVREFTDQYFNYGAVPWGVLFFDNGTLYTVEGAYNSSTGQCYYRVWRGSDGATVTIGDVPCWGNWPYLRRVSQSNVLIAIYSATTWGGPTQLTGIWELNLPNFSVTQVQGTITGVTGGNAYAFRDSSGYIHLIQISNQYIVKLYKQSQTQVKIVTTDINGNPVPLTLNVYANQGWVNEFGGDRNQLVGQVTTNNDGVGYFTYTGPLSLLQFEYASSTEGYGYNYITLGVPQWKAIRLGPSDEYA